MSKFVFFSRQNLPCEPIEKVQIFRLQNFSCALSSKVRCRLKLKNNFSFVTMSELLLASVKVGFYRKICRFSCGNKLHTRSDRSFFANEFRRLSWTHSRLELRIARILVHFRLIKDQNSGRISVRPKTRPARPISHWIHFRIFTLSQKVWNKRNTQPEANWLISEKLYRR